METKVCNKCNLEKDICEFGKLKSSRDGYRYFCKKCRNNIEKTYEGSNVSERKKKWRNNNKEKIKNHYQETKQIILDYQKKYREENLDKIKERGKNIIILIKKKYSIKIKYIEKILKILEIFMNPRRKKMTQFTHYYVV